MVSVGKYRFLQQLLALETGQMSAVETGQMTAAETSVLSPQKTSVLSQYCPQLILAAGCSWLTQTMKFKTLIIFCLKN